MDECDGRRSFFEDEFLEVAYCFCLNLCRRGNFPINKFHEVIDRATRKRVWSYAGMRLWLLPYVLMTLENITAHSKKSRYSFHFVFERPRRGGASAVLQSPEECSLLKVFSGGHAVTANDNPLPVSEKVMFGTAGDTSWVDAALLRRLSRR